MMQFLNHEDKSERRKAAHTSWPREGTDHEGCVSRGERGGCAPAQAGEALGQVESVAASCGGDRSHSKSAVCILFFKSLPSREKSVFLIVE